MTTPSPTWMSSAQVEIRKQAREMRKKLADLDLEAEFVAPRLWEHPNTIDGAFTSNDEGCRRYAIERSKKAADIGREMGTNLMVLWLAREGTYLREAKDARLATQRLLEAVDTLLDYDRDLKILIEPKPNEPMDQAYIPTIGHALALGFQASDPGAGRRAGRIGPCHPGRPGSFRRDGICPGL